MREQGVRTERGSPSSERESGSVFWQGGGIAPRPPMTHIPLCIPVYLSFRTVSS